MGCIDNKESVRAATRSGSALRSLYEAARQEVLADPAAAIRKYQPGWDFWLPAAVAASQRTPQRLPRTANHR